MSDVRLASVCCTEASRLKFLVWSKIARICSVGTLLDISEMIDFHMVGLGFHASRFVVERPRVNGLSVQTINNDCLLYTSDAADE